MTKHWDWDELFNEDEDVQHEILQRLIAHLFKLQQGDIIDIGVIRGAQTMSGLELDFLENRSPKRQTIDFDKMAKEFNRNKGV